MTVSITSSRKPYGRKVAEQINYNDNLNYSYNALATNTGIPPKVIPQAPETINRPIAYQTAPVPLYLSTKLVRLFTPVPDRVRDPP